jgi:hypothetical protein
MGSTEPGALQDAMLITAAQKVEHYEIATYGTVRTYASVVGARGVAKLLQETLREEKAADKKLTAIAEGSVNRRASQEYHEQTASATDMLQKGAEWVGSAVGGAFKSVMPRSTQAADRTRASSSRSSSRSSRGSRKTSGRKTARRSRKSTR